MYNRKQPSTRHQAALTFRNRTMAQAAQITKAAWEEQVMEVGYISVI
jgi:hypothetical protein